MKKLIVGNWKMNPDSLIKAERLFKSFDIKTKNEVVLCPPFVFLKPGRNYKLGAQDCFYKETGAFTGEVSPKMLKSLGCQYVIIGHSERREIMKEKDVEIGKKVKEALKSKLKPILCVGEKKGEDRKIVIKRELKGIPDGIIIAYEPIWSIGTGKIPKMEEIEESFELIKKISPKSKILYGGSVNGENIKNILQVADGALIGGASLNVKEFIKIIKGCY